MTQELKKNIRPLTALLSAMIGALLVGGLLAPWLFNGLIALGRAFAGLQFLRDTEFERVATRTVEGCFILLLIPALRWGRFASRRALGLAPTGKGVRTLLAGFCLGLASMGIVFAAGWGLGAYVPKHAFGPAVAGRALWLVPAALLVGFIEEILFRGVIFGALRRASRFWLATVAASLFFALLHFARPEPPVGVVYGHWDSGLRLMAYVFVQPGGGVPEFPFVLTLFLIGAMLCVVYEWTGALYAPMGLHAGWVWVMRGGPLFFAVRGETPGWFFGEAKTPEKSYAALAAAGLLFVLLPLIYRRRRER